MFEKANKPLILFSMLILAALMVPMGLFPEKSAGVIGSIFGFITMDLAWLFMLIGVVCLGVAIFLIGSKYGDIKLGGADAKPHYKTFTWIAMMLCSALAAGILIFGMIEWMYYVTGTPFGVEPMSTEAYEYASAYGMFHWGFSAWSFYLLPGIAIGYMYWNKKVGSLRVSDSCSAILGTEKTSHKILRYLVDGFVSFTYIGGLMTTIALGTPVMAELISALTGVPNTFGLRIAVIVIFCIFFMLSTSQSIAKGMALISDFNVKLAIGFFAFILIAGPTMWMMNNFTMAVGKNIQEFFKMSFYTDSIAQTGFVQGWTIFYWAWYVGLAILTGVWIARVSYGRTFREIAVATVVWAPIACWITFAILGNYGMSLELSGQMMLSQIVLEQGSSAATLAVLKTLPFATLAIIVFLVLIFFNLATSATAMATSLSILTSVNLKEDEEPNKYYKLFWSFIFLALPVSILFLEHNVEGLNILNTIKSLTTLYAIPVLFVMAMLLTSFGKVLKKDISSGEILDSIEPYKRFKWDYSRMEKEESLNAK
jgi:BCCT family betaine/carnitine transporter